MFNLIPTEIYSITDYKTSPATGRPTAHTITGDGNAFRNGLAHGALLYGFAMQALAAKLDY